MPNIQETLVKAVSIRGGEILKDKKILCNILEDLSPDLYSTIAFINKIYTSAVGEMLFKAYSAKNEQRKTYIKEADRILEEEEDRGSKSRKAFFSYFEFLIIQGDTEQKVPAKDKTSIWMKDGVAAFANAVNGRKAKLEGWHRGRIPATRQNLTLLLWRMVMLSRTTLMVRLQKVIRKTVFGTGSLRKLSKAEHILKEPMCQVK